MLDKFKYLSAAIIILAVLFKLHHWQGAGIMLTVGPVFKLTRGVKLFISNF